MRRLALTLTIASLVAACDQAPTSKGESGKIDVEKVWVRLPAVANGPGAAYFTVRGGPKETKLVGADSKGAKRIELHESMAHGGMTGMTPLRDIAIPANGSLAFKPGERHAMLFDIADDVKPFERFSIRFRFADGSIVEADAFPVAAGDPEPGFTTPSEGSPCTPGMARDDDSITVTNCGE